MTHKGNVVDKFDYFLKSEIKDEMVYDDGEDTGHVSFYVDFIEEKDKVLIIDDFAANWWAQETLKELGLANEYQVSDCLDHCTFEMKTVHVMEKIKPFFTMEEVQNSRMTHMKMPIKKIQKIE